MDTEEYGLLRTGARDTDDRAGSGTPSKHWRSQGVAQGARTPTFALVGVYIMNGRGQQAVTA